MREIAVWVVAVEILGLVVLPPLREFFGNRRDAALLSRPLGLAVTAYVAWILTLIATGAFTRATMFLALLLVAGFALWRHRRLARKAPENAGLWGAEETRAAVLFWGCCAVFLLLRAAYPEIYGQEKYMDLAFLNSINRYGAMPPFDPWMAGRTINYYYWGYLLAAALTKLAAVPTMLAYNLSIATFAGGSFTAAACLGFRLSGGRRAAALWAATATVFGGNLVGALDAWHAPLGRGFDYWHASRVIGAGNTINEFPFFTFLQADLHPHLLAFPFFLAAFAVASRYVELSELGKEARSAGRRVFALAGPVLLLAFTAGTARAANAWNLPAIGFLLAFAGLFRRSGARRWPSRGEIVPGLVEGALLFFLALALFWPYSLSYALVNKGLAAATMHSGLIEFLGVWGILFAAAFAALLPTLATEDERQRRGRALTIAAVAMGSLVLALAKNAPALVVLIPLGVLAARLLVRALSKRSGDSGQAFLGFCLLLAVAIIAGCEFVYFRDDYGADLQRMNTIFKFYHQAWPLLAVAAAVLAERAWAAGGRGSRALRAVLAVSIVLLLLYPADALLWRLSQVQGGLKLSAWSALARRSPGDAAAIAWLERNARSGMVVLEASGDPYSDFARISSHTGIPTVLGWANHEGLWRGGDEEIGQRWAMIRAFYGGADDSIASSILQRFHVTHVVLGDLERRAYPAADRIARYPFLEAVFPGPTTVYRVLLSR